MSNISIKTVSKKSSKLLSQIVNLNKANKFIKEQTLSPNKNIKSINVKDNSKTINKCTAKNHLSITPKKGISNLYISKSNNKGKMIRDIFDINVSIENNNEKTDDYSNSKYNKNVYFSKPNKDIQNKISLNINKLISNSIKDKSGNVLVLRKLSKVVSSSVKATNNNNNDEDSPLKSFFNTLTQKNNKRNFSYIQNNDNTISKLSLNNGQHIKYNNKEECILKNDINNTFSNNNNKHKSKELLKPNDDELIYVPCINCSNMISIDFIESHTDICNVTTDEQNNLDNINNEFSTINFKLMKLKDHLENIKLNSNLLYNKETYIVEIVDQTLKDAIHIAKIDSNSVNNLKKFLTNLEVI